MRALCLYSCLSLAACARSPRSPSASPLDRIPNDAVGAIVVGAEATKPLRDLFSDDRETRAELSAYLEQQLGVDLTQIQGVVAFSTHLGEPPSAAVIVELPTTLHSSLKLAKAGAHEGVDLFAPSEGLVAAAIPGGFVLGSLGEVKAAIDVTQHKRPSLSAQGPLGELRRTPLGPREMALAVQVTAIQDPQLQAIVQLYGVTDALLRIVPDVRIALSLGGDARKLEDARTAFHMLRDGATAKLKLERDEAKKNSDVASGVGAILSYHQARLLFQKVEPQLRGGRLSFELAMPKMETPMTTVAVVGIVAAVAIPAFMKYIRRSKTTEALMNVRKLYDASVAYYESERVDARGRPLPKRFPPSVAITPAKSCCDYPGEKCPPDPQIWRHPTWAALQFAIDEPHFYRYEYKSSGQGANARFVARAYGDLDCDGVLSTYERQGSVDQDGLVVASPLEVVNDIE